MAKSITLADGSRATIGGRSGKSHLSLHISGAKELDGLLAELAPQVGIAVYKDMTRKIAKPILEYAKAVAPKRTGALVDSLKIRGLRRKPGRIGVQVVTSKGWFTGKTYYAGFQEYGWRAGSRKRGVARPQIPGKKFVTYAYERAQSSFEDDIRRILAEAVVVVTRRLAKRVIKKAS